MRPIIISFYTNDWIYPTHATRLRSECAKHGHRHRINELPSLGDYKANTRLKSSYIKEAILELKEPVAWLDVDAYMLRPIEIDITGADVAACRMPPESTRIYRVGTLVFNYTPAALQFLDKWISLSTVGTDESAFDRAVKAGVGNTVIKELPIEYHRVKGKKTPFSAMPESTVICHTLSESESKLALKRAGKL